MRILIISNYYPPYFFGGYELNCSEAAQGLRARGHDVRVLTSTYGMKGSSYDGDVYRWLETDIGWEPRPLGLRALRLLKRELHNQSSFKRVAREFKPDLVYFWNLVSISISIAFWAQRLNIPTSFWIGDKWLTCWRQDQWYAIWPPAPRRRAVRAGSLVIRWLLARLGILTTETLDLRHVQFASEFLKRVTLAAGEPVAESEVTHWGVEVGRFPFREEARVPTRLLFSGQVLPHKGVHTAVEAMKIIVRDRGCSNLTLTIVGPSMMPDYEARLRDYVREHGLEEQVSFIGFVPRERLTEVYRSHDALLFPSVCDEGLGISLLEAMASGLVVLGTASGGSAEIMEHNVNALIFPKEDAGECAEQILRLAGDSQLCERLRHQGRRTVEERFRIEVALDRVERSLSSVARAD